MKLRETRQMVLIRYPFEQNNMLKIFQNTALELIQISNTFIHLLLACNPKMQITMDIIIPRIPSGS